MSIHNTSTPWRHWCHHRTDTIALHVNQQAYTWQQVTALVNAYAEALSSQGLKPNDVMMLVGKNSPELVLVYLACLQLDVIPALLPPQPYVNLQQKQRSLYQQDKSQYIWFVDDNTQGFTTQQYTELEQSVCFITVPLLSSFDVGVNKKHELQTADNKESIHPNAINIASIIFTSGSTGNPKAVAHSQANHFASATGLLTEFEFTLEDNWLLSLPMYHVSGLAIIWRWLLVGAQLKVGSGDLSQDIKGVSHASLVATQLQRLLSEGTPLNLKRVLLGGSHIPLALATQATSVGIDTWLGYGMTEAASTVTVKRIDGKEGAGALLPQRLLTIMQQRVLIAGDTLAVGYYYQGQLSPLLNENGWFDTKDLAKWRNNDLVIIGRADNQFISGGENIHCEEIEAALTKHSDITQAFVLPVYDNEFGMRSVALIQTAHLHESDYYQAFLSDFISKFKCPVAFYLMPELNHSGIKVSRQVLKHWFNETQNTYQAL